MNNVSLFHKAIALPVEGHSEGATQVLLCSSITVPLGHWQPLTQGCEQDIGVFSLAHVMLHGEAHSVQVWPSTGQPIINDKIIIA